MREYQVSLRRRRRRSVVAGSTLIPESSNKFIRRRIGSHRRSGPHFDGRRSEINLMKSRNVLIEDREKEKERERELGKREFQEVTLSWVIRPTTLPEEGLGRV